MHLPAVHLPAAAAVVLASLAPVAAIEVTTVVGGKQGDPLDNPFSVGFTPDGRMTVVEYGGSRLLRLEPDGSLTTLAGTLGEHGYSGDGGPATAAKFDHPHNHVTTKSGDVYISDTFNHVARKVDAATGVITTVAGDGTAGPPPDRFNELYCVALTPDEGGLLIADLKNRRVRSLDLQTGRTRLVAGDGTGGVPEDGARADEAPLVDPRAVCADASGAVYILSRSGHSLLRVSRGGRITTVAGTGEKGESDGPALGAQFDGPKHLCVAEDGKSVVIADCENHRICLYDPELGTVTTVLGGAGRVGGTTLKRPHGVYVDGAGALYVADSENHRVLKLTGWR
jgi:hypothetical protein